MRMQCVARQLEDALMLLRPTFRDELEIKIRIGPVDFIANDRMPDVREMHA